MSLFSDLFGRHGHRKDKVIQELLEIIKKMENEAILSERNEQMLIKENLKIYNDLRECMEKKEPKAYSLTAKYELSH